VRGERRVAIAPAGGKPAATLPRCRSGRTSVTSRSSRTREYSFVDGTSFSLMRALGIGAAFAFDGDFSAAGFVELRP
jgi:hypothetical protein